MPEVDEEDSAVTVDVTFLLQFPIPIPPTEEDLRSSRNVFEIFDSPPPVASALFGENHGEPLEEPERETPSDRPLPSEMRVSSTWLTAIQSLRTVVRSNLEHFTSRISGAEGKYRRFFQCFNQLEEDAAAIQPVLDSLNKNASKYDFKNIPANGFRSLLTVTDNCMCHLVRTSRQIERQRENFLFRRNFHLRDLEEYTKVLGALRKMLHYADDMMKLSDDTGSVFPKEGSSLIEEWFEEMETLNQEVFYGRSLGFQYSPSMHTALQTITLAMAVCAETYQSWETWKPGSANLATTIPNMLLTTRLFMKPELRAKKIVYTTRNADINFCKQFWGLTEASYLQSSFKWILPSVAVNKVIELPPEMIEVPGVGGRNILVKPPSYSKPIFTRFISDVENFGRTRFAGNDQNEAKLSSSLIFHCHGGGFIAQSSKAHECYLLKWAKDLKTPIFSVDYALAPEQPYPKGLDEVVYAYAWAVKNHEELGWTGEKVCFVGDSAGANLVVGAALKIFCKGLKPPTGILAAYGAFLVQYTPSPSRLLCLMDPILPMGILTRCLAAYAGIPEPSCVGQVQGANDKVSHENLKEKSLQTDARLLQSRSFDSENSIGTSSTQTAEKTDRIETPWSGITNDAATGSDTTDGSIEKRHPVPRTSHWFGKAVTSLFENLQGKPIEETANKLASEDPQEPWTPDEVRTMRGSDKVAPLPRYNFASVSVEDPFLSPLLAEDHILVGLPPTYLVACHLDPLLDDSISFARRLAQLNKPVHLDVISHLPHGFLNFSLLSSEAAEATALCAKRILEILEADQPRVDGQTE